ncbi:Protein of unknown function [Pyronema omphalodes CBS 100304]|uniref:Uncharacterized protein n=1 Tax=Pyronema omphalodes (strain CBS 100304) TaxID=1076935 RepID=U4LVC9_PYROM|nr:Protein of unknown function [Pyronema omphalodes CBS 100304]
MNSTLDVVAFVRLHCTTHQFTLA